MSVDTPRVYLSRQCRVTIFNRSAMRDRKGSEPIDGHHDNLGTLRCGGRVTRIMDICIGMSANVNPIQVDAQRVAVAGSPGGGWRGGQTSPAGRACFRNTYHRVPQHLPR